MLPALLQPPQDAHYAYDMWHGHDYFPFTYVPGSYSLALPLSLSVCLPLVQLANMLRLLLVVPLLLCAQTRAAVTSQQPGLLQQALGDAARALQRAENLLKDATPSPSSTLTSNSVVQDWSLVCKELCG